MDKKPTQLYPQTKKRLIQFKLEKSAEIGHVISESEAIDMLLDYYYSEGGKNEGKSNNP